MSKVITLEELRRLPCMVCGEAKCPAHGDEAFVLLSRCHPDAGVHAALDRDTGVLTLLCRECARHVVALQVERQVQ